MCRGKGTGHLLGAITCSANLVDAYGWPIEARAFAAVLMIARLLSQASSCPAVRLRKPAYLTAPDIVAAVARGVGDFWGIAGRCAGL